MTRVSLTISQIRQMRVGTRCLIQGKTIYFSRAITPGESIRISATTYDSEITPATLPEHFQLAAQYYILWRYYSNLDATRANYYSGLFNQQWAQVRHDRTAITRCELGEDL